MTPYPSRKVEADDFAFSSTETDCCAPCALRCEAELHTSSALRTAEKKAPPLIRIFRASRSVSKTSTDCWQPFIWTADDQSLFRERGFTYDPTRCQTCRQALIKESMANIASASDVEAATYANITRVCVLFGACSFSEILTSTE